MDLGIEGRSALVTGASMGIGRAIAAELAKNGVDVAIVARNRERLGKAATEMSTDSNGRVVAVPGDMAKVADIESAVRATREAFGRIDILINNAGASPAGGIDDLDDVLWQSSFDLKLMGYMRCARAVLPEMRDRRWGRIVNIIGRGGEIATPNYLLGAFNAALLHFTRALALHAAEYNVLVNGINPGATNTPRWHAIAAQKAKASGRDQAEVEAEWIASVPLGRAAQPEDIADLAVFLCSERARHVVGALMNIDGGGAKGV